MKQELDSNQKKLQSLQRVYQLFHDAENVRDWIATKHKLAAAEGYGKDYEHWQVNILYILLCFFLNLLICFL